MPPLIYPEDSDDEEYLIDPPSADPTPEPGPPSEKPTNETTSEPDSDALSETSSPMREDYMGNLDPKEISRYQKGSDLPRFATLEKRTKESPWGDTWKIRILGQGKILEAGQDLITPTKIPSKIPINFEEVDQDAIGGEFTREHMVNICSTKDPLVREKRELLIWHHRLNHFSLKYLIRLSKKGMITRNLRNIRTSPPCVACMFGNSHNRSWMTEGKHSIGSIKKPSETRPGAMNSIDQMVSAQPGLINQVTGALTHVRF